jgi:hypothetical protein
MTTKPEIYEQHNKAFADVSAFVIMDGAERVGSVAIKRMRSGRTVAYVWWHEHGMAKGSANGGGYDKDSAAVEVALTDLRRSLPRKLETPNKLADFVLIARTASGAGWQDCARTAGLVVYQAV